MNQKIATAKATIELLVAREKPHANVVNVDAWQTSIRNRYRTEHWDFLSDRLDVNPDLTADELAAEIFDAKAEADPRPPTVRHHDDRVECPECGATNGGGWLESPDRDELGMTPDLVPCPKCAPDRHRLWQQKRDQERRDEYHASHAASVQYLREHRPELKGSDT